jgi:hypothetical protein
MPDDEKRNTVQQYVGDMVALEGHIEEALDGQLKENPEHARAAEALRRFHTTVRGNRDSLKAHLKELGGSESSPIKSAVAAIFGMAAGAVNLIRTEKLSKSLRDDYTAFNHAAISYAMLHTTAHALGHLPTMEIAERHLRSYAEAVQEINQLIADVVVWEFQKDGLSVDQTAVQHCTKAINRVWRETAPQHVDTRRAA